MVNQPQRLEVKVFGSRIRAEGALGIIGAVAIFLILVGAQFLQG